MKDACDQYKDKVIFNTATNSFYKCAFDGTKGGCRVNHLPRTEIAEIRTVLEDFCSSELTGTPGLKGKIGASCGKTDDCQAGNLCHTTEGICLENMTGADCYGAKNLCVQGMVCESNGCMPEEW